METGEVVTCDRCGEFVPSVRETLGCLLCADCTGWLRSLNPVAVEAERPNWAVPAALTDVAVAKIAAAQASEAAEKRRLRHKAAKRATMHEGPQYKHR